MLNRKEHLIWIDILRIIAIILVILCHSTEEGIYDFSLNSVLELTYAKRLFPFMCFTLGRLGVPIFLLITGYLLLDKEYDTEAMKRFWKNNWLHLIICTMTWFLAYDLFLIFVQGKEIPIGDIIQDVLFLNKVQMSHVWYMPMIIGVYAFVPFVANGINKTYNLRIIWIPVSFFLACFFLYPTLSVVLHTINPTLRSFAMQINIGFSGGIYGIYLLMGWLLKKGQLKQIKSGWLVFFLVLSFCMMLWLQLWTYNNSFRYSLWYDSPFLLISAICIFELLSRCRFNREYTFLRWLSGYAFAIYLIHFPFKLILLDSIMSISCLKEIQVLIMWGLLLIVSLLLAVVISIVPICGNYIIYRKSSM